MTFIAFLMPSASESSVAAERAVLMVERIRLFRPTRDAPEIQRIRAPTMFVSVSSKSSLVA